jgi:hypothetical protein
METRVFQELKSCVYWIERNGLDGDRPGDLLEHRF